MGKTVTCQLLTMELLERFKKNVDTPLPVYLDLRDIEEAGQGNGVSLENSLATCSVAAAAMLCPLQRK